MGISKMLIIYKSFLIATSLSDRILENRIAFKFVVCKNILYQVCVCVVVYKIIQLKIYSYSTDQNPGEYFKCIGLYNTHQ